MIPISEAPPARIRAPSEDTGSQAMSPKEEDLYAVLKGKFAKLSPSAKDPVLTGEGRPPVRRPSNPDAAKTPSPKPD